MIGLTMPKTGGGNWSLIPSFFQNGIWQGFIPTAAIFARNIAHVKKDKLLKLLLEERTLLRNKISRHN